ncbi:MAG: 5-formyltetrahydrofolate cyclo-ligase [Rickettsiales bacterium]|nr:5-formyltetrahydrofolate cyclo-ligase [Rickettsiales bacterium]
MNKNSKSELRKYFLNKRQNCRINSELIIQNLFNFLKLKSFESIGIYYPIKQEVDILRIIALLDKSIQIALPVVKNNTIEFYIWDKTQNSLIENPKFKILEPNIKESRILKPDIIITPLLSYDKNNIRLGYGGGFYDRYLKQNPKIIKIGIASVIQKHDSDLPAEPHDIKLDHVITETF